jgi:DNA-binding MarR family transcriptional regulator
MSELATSLLLSASGITRLIDQLVERQWVERQPDPSDARVAIACLTREGRNALRRAGVIYADGVRRHFAAFLNVDDLAAIAGAMERLLAASTPPARPIEIRSVPKRRS